jgi:hypothetical protein
MVCLEAFDLKIKMLKPIKTKTARASGGTFAIVAPRQRIFTADFSFARLRFSRIIEAATISDFHGQTRRHQQVARQLRA